MALAKGIRPDEVVRDHRSDALFVFANLRPELDASGARAFLEQFTTLVTRLTGAVKGERQATIAVGFGASFFTRFGLDALMPAGLRTPPTTPALVSFDIGLYIMSRSSAVTSDFLHGLAETNALTAVALEQGYQRTDGRELFGFLDGQRNPRRADRREIAFVDRGVTPEEPAWTEEGSYLAYMKLPQRVAEFAALPLEQQEAIMGRRKSDGSRLDLAAGTDARTEGEFAGDQPGRNSHVRKSGPRGALHDQVRIFRRGVPYLSLNADGTLAGGLQFVAFLSSLDNFGVVLDRWMNNDAFPTPGTGPDALFAQGFVNVEKAAYFFVPPYESGRTIGVSMFDPPSTRAPRRTREGRVVIRKHLVDQNGTPSLTELGGFGFQIFGRDGQPLGGVFRTNPAGRAISDRVPTKVDLTVREVEAPPGFPGTLATEQHVTLEGRRALLEFTNTIPSGSTY